MSASQKIFFFQERFVVYLFIYFLPACTSYIVSPNIIILRVPLNFLMSKKHACIYNYIDINREFCRGTFSNITLDMEKAGLFTIYKDLKTLTVQEAVRKEEFACLVFTLIVSLIQISYLSVWITCF